jgi:hypothetical protein
MRIVAIDPGHTSGICVAELDTFARHTILKQLYSWTWDWDQFPQVFTGYEADMYIVEGIPHFNPHPAQAHRYNETLRMLRGAFIIDPPQWKPIAKAQSWKHPDADTQHENDAYNLLRFWYLTTYRADLGIARLSQNGS